MVYLTMYYAHMAGINVGIITAIWSCEIFFCAILDYFIYHEVLFKSHLIGMVLIVLSSVCISLANNIEGGSNDKSA